jgi:hypothetical protein
MRGQIALIKKLCLLLLLSAASSISNGQIKWPQGQLLPSFPPTAHNQDLILLRETPTQWQAERPGLSHATGRPETDGWLCEPGIDSAHRYMIYGPYDTNIPAGSNVAEFRMKTDNNSLKTDNSQLKNDNSPLKTDHNPLKNDNNPLKTHNNSLKNGNHPMKPDNNTVSDDPVVDIDVRNATTGETIAFRKITRKDFPTTGDYTDFTLPFTLTADKQSIELRVFWHGTAYTKVDRVKVQQNNSTAEMYLFASLKGIVNKTSPRIFSYEGDASAEGPYIWLQSLGLSWTEHVNKWDLITKYRNGLSGLIVYDLEQIHTVNLATMLAKDKKAIIASPALIARLTAAPYNLPVLVDLRGQFASKLAVYEAIYDKYWPKLDHRILIGLNPNAHKGALREYATALGTAVIWLDPKVAGESELLDKFLSSMPAGANFMGWWPEEAPGVGRASTFGIATIASDFATNLTVHSGMPRAINKKPIPPKPPLQNKLYVAFILSDGDNLQYVEHHMRKLWSNPDRGSVPMGWTISPAMLDAMPGALNYYWKSSTDNDNLISGPSGYGYAYPNTFPDQRSLNDFVSKTEDYNRRAGLGVVTIWNTITGGINQQVGETFARLAPSVLGLTAQNTGGGLTVYDKKLPGMALSCNYCTDEQAMKNHITKASAGWNRAEPRFIIIQAQPWKGVGPSSFKNVAASLNEDYIVVRPDHIFQLMREANGLDAKQTKGR